MPKSARIPKSIVDAFIIIEEALSQKIPADYALKSAIETLMPNIVSMQNKGYSISEIADLLTKNNLKIGSTTLRQYITEFNKKDVVIESAKKIISKKIPSNVLKSALNIPLNVEKDDKEKIIKPLEQSVSSKSASPQTDKRFNNADLNNL